MNRQQQHSPHLVLAQPTMPAKERQQAQLLEEVQLAMDEIEATRKALPGLTKKQRIDSLVRVGQLELLVEQLLDSSGQLDKGAAQHPSPKVQDNHHFSIPTITGGSPSSPLRGGSGPSSQSPPRQHHAVGTSASPPGSPGGPMSTSVKTTKWPKSDQQPQHALQRQPSGSPPRQAGQPQHSPSPIPTSQSSTLSVAHADYVREKSDNSRRSEPHGQSGANTFRGSGQTRIPLTVQDSQYQSRGAAGATLNVQRHLLKEATAQRATPLAEPHTRPRIITTGPVSATTTRSTNGKDFTLSSQPQQRSGSGAFGTPGHISQILDEMRTTKYPTPVGNGNVTHTLTRR